MYNKSYHVAGTSYRNPEDLNRIASILKAYGKAAPGVILTLEEDNPYDPNAIKIQIHETKPVEQNTTIGYIHTKQNAELRQFLKTHPDVTPMIELIGFTEDKPSPGFIIHI